MTSTQVHKGDTIRLKASFYTFAGVLADPASVTCTVYDNSETPIIEPAVATKDSTGVYYFDYTTTALGSFSFEFSGTLEGKAILSRECFVVIW
jgi:hypothetical protein